MDTGGCQREVRVFGVSRRFPLLYREGLLQMFHPLGVLPFVDQYRAEERFRRAQVQLETGIAAIGRGELRLDGDGLASARDGFREAIVQHEFETEQRQHGTAISLIVDVGGGLGMERVQPGHGARQDFQSAVIFFLNERAAQLELRKVEFRARAGSFGIGRQDLLADLDGAIEFLPGQVDFRQIVLGFEAGRGGGSQLPGGLEGALEAGPLFAVGIEQLRVAEVGESKLVAERGIVRVGRRLRLEERGAAGVAFARAREACPL